LTENVLTVDVEEYYNSVEFSEALGDDVRTLPSRVVEQTERLLDLLDAHGARGTFFTLGTVAARHPRLVRQIVVRGHELASHGWDHSLAYVQGPARFRLDVRRARHALEQASGRAVRGYRAPNYSIRPDTPWAFSILADEGYAYDSSINPIAHDRYGFPSAPRFRYALAEGISEVPVGTARFAGVNLPVGGGFFRLFPLGLIRAAIERVNRLDAEPVVFFMHPWELDPEQPRPPMSARARFRHYVGLTHAYEKLETLLRAFSFTSIDRAWPDVSVPRAIPMAASLG
jgi:polysaccharide deacetylase family protein (PEP-CTERM system associated)